MEICHQPAILKWEFFAWPKVQTIGAAMQVYNPSRRALLAASPESAKFTLIFTHRYLRV